MPNRSKFQRPINPHAQRLIAEGKQPSLRALEDALDSQNGYFYEVAEQCFLLTNTPPEEGKPYRGVKALFAEVNRGQTRFKSASAITKHNQIYEAFAVIGGLDRDEFNTLAGRWTVAARAARFLLKRQDQGPREWYQLVLECTEQEIAQRIADLEGREATELTSEGVAVKRIIRQVQVLLANEFGLYLSADQIKEYRIQPLLGNTPEDRALRAAFAEALGETRNPLLEAIERYDTEEQIAIVPGGAITQQQLKKLKKWLKGKVEFRRYLLEPTIRYYLSAKAGGS